MSSRRSGVEAAEDKLRNLIGSAMSQDEAHATPRPAAPVPAAPPPALVPKGSGFAPMRQPMQDPGRGMQARPRPLYDDPNYSKTTIYMRRDLKPRAKAMAELMRVDVSQLVNTGLSLLLDDLEAGMAGEDDGSERD